METRASYLAVAAFLLVLIFGGVGFALWTAKTTQQGQLVSHFARFPSSVAGLQVGSSVLFGGIPVGQVTAIGVDPEDSSLTRVELSVRAEAPIRAASVATLEPKSLIGGVVVQISRASPASPLLAPGVEIIAARSPFERLFDNAPKMATKAGAVMDQAAAFMTPQNGAALVRILANVDRINAAIERNSDGLDQVLADGRATKARIDGSWAEISRLIEELKQNGGRLSENGRQALAELGRMAASFTRAKTDINGILAENDKSIQDFWSMGYPQLPVLFRELGLVARNYSRLWREVHDDPARFFLTDRDQGYQAK
jgi:phospholipid/cholesterol/gamma-HCH transport system substrate-binding protein